MLGNMMDNQLLISGVIEHAEKYHSDAEIVSRTVEGPIHRYTYSDAAKRSRKLANALVNLGLKEGDTVGTLAWNTFRHFELYFGVSGIGCVVNTVNPRLFPEQLTYIINHAENQYLFIDLSFVELVESLESTFDSIKGFIVLTDKDNMPDTNLKNVICYEDFIEKESEEFDWGVSFVGLLREGDKVFSTDSEEVTVKSVSDNGTATVYHLTDVEHTNTYFVEGVLVHNGGGMKR